MFDYFPVFSVYTWRGHDEADLFLGWPSPPLLRLNHIGSGAVPYRTTLVCRKPTNDADSAGSFRNPRFFISCVDLKKKLLEHLPISNWYLSEHVKTRLKARKYPRYWVFANRNIISFNESAWCILNPYQDHRICKAWLRIPKIFRPRGSVTDIFLLLTTF